MTRTTPCIVVFVSCICGMSGSILHEAHSRGYCVVWMTKGPKQSLEWGGTHLLMEDISRWALQKLRILYEDTVPRNVCPNPQSHLWYVPILPLPLCRSLSSIFLCPHLSLCRSLASLPPPTSLHPLVPRPKTPLSPSTAAVAFPLFVTRFSSLRRHSRRHSLQAAVNGERLVADDVARRRSVSTSRMRTRQSEIRSASSPNHRRLSLPPPTAAGSDGQHTLPLHCRRWIWWVARAPAAPASAHFSPFSIPGRPLWIHLRRATTGGGGDDTEEEGRAAEEGRVEGKTGGKSSVHRLLP